jgi:predicted RNase H-like HicB family nuclease
MKNYMFKSAQKFYLYPITIEPCEEGGFFADCPSLQGCHAEGETYGEAIDNIRDVIAARLSAEKKSTKIKTNSGLALENPFKMKLEFSLPVCL